MEYIEQVDLPGELVDYDEQRELMSQLFAPKLIPLEVIKGVMSTGLLTFDQLLARYEPALIGYLDEESQALLKVFHDGAYLQEAWSWLGDTNGYKQWVHIYMENCDRLSEIASYYSTHPDYGFDLTQSAQDAKNELYLAQTQPGEPTDFNYDGYTDIHQEPDTQYIQILVPGDGDYPHYLDDPEENYFHEDRGISSIPIQQAEDLELKPVEYLNLHYSDIGKIIEKVRRTAVSYRKRNYILRRDWKKLGLPCKPKYLDEAQLEQILKNRMGTGLSRITEKLSDLLVQGVPKQDVLLLLLDGVYIDFLSRRITIPSEGCTLQQFAQDFADEVLDHAWALQDPPGWYTSDEHFYFSQLDKTDINDFVLYSDEKVEYSKGFNAVVLEHILAGASVKDAYRNAYHHNLMSQSPLGAHAYKLGRFYGKNHSQALKDFYQSAKSVGDIKDRDRIIDIHQDELVILTASSGYKATRQINPKIVQLKVRNSELFVAGDTPLDFKQRLMKYLSPLKLTKTQLSSLHE